MSTRSVVYSLDDAQRGVIPVTRRAVGRVRKRSPVSGKCAIVKLDVASDLVLAVYICRCSWSVFRIWHLGRGYDIFQFRAAPGLSERRVGYVSRRDTNLLVIRSGLFVCG